MPVGQLRAFGAVLPATVSPFHFIECDWKLVGFCLVLGCVFVCFVLVRRLFHKFPIFFRALGTTTSSAKGIINS